MHHKFYKIILHTINNSFPSPDNDTMIAESKKRHSVFIMSGLDIEDLLSTTFYQQKSKQHLLHMNE